MSKAALRSDAFRKNLGEGIAHRVESLQYGRVENLAAYSRGEPVDRNDSPRSRGGAFRGLELRIYKLRHTARFAGEFAEKHIFLADFEFVFKIGAVEVGDINGSGIVGRAEF